eukprot:CAMPEP_0118678854 /NCGR_PEP_ID=MMETSP0800-20121206/3454_1 /TAXON_ID=210618 ORGANISM="Striatella unipunctata, Strain CCMP2910" /NCGR_SAMPLE_ID=MMETSP0800 /ASSEMBLY_ACC=CAM_ASM_000638 /LENGTH=40 /DNA_ID= /DNA_START= /DNA_END= /DNA_ORIENTATION=
MMAAKKKASMHARRRSTVAHDFLGMTNGSQLLPHFLATTA